MNDPTLIEQIITNKTLFVILTMLIGFAVIGIFATCEEIAFRVKRRRYRKERDESRGSKWTKKSSVNSTRTRNF